MDSNSRKEANAEAVRRYRATEKGRETVARYRRKTKTALQARVSALKTSIGCVDCGYSEHPVALDFDHVDGDKVSGIAALVTRLAPWPEILSEIAKCEVRCANCHRIKTHESR